MTDQAKLDADVPCIVEPGWSRADHIANPAGPAYRLLWWSNTRVGFEHRCDRGQRGVIICAPRLQEGHNVTLDMGPGGAAQPTVNPSILCDDCGTHGFIRAGQWLAA